MIWVAEIGSAHGGDKSLAFELIRQAKLAGATIAKFQLGWTPEAEDEYAGGHHKAPVRADYKTSIRYIDDWVYDLAEWCGHFDIEFMASIWSFSGLEAARDVEMKRYKVAHQMRNSRLIYSMLSDHKTVFMSCTSKRVTELEYNIKDQVAQIFCSPEYPQYPPVEISLGGFYGYSSHMHGIADALLAVAQGAKYIEKHVTLNKTNPLVRDNTFALSFEEYAEMVRIGNEIARLV